MNIKSFLRIKFILIAAIVLIITFGLLIAYGYYSSGPAFRNADVMSKDFVNVQFREETNIKMFAQRYNIDFEKIEHPSKTGIYRIPVIKGKGVLSTIEIFEKDSDVISVGPEIYYHAF